MDLFPLIAVTSHLGLKLSQEVNSLDSVGIVRTQRFLKNRLWSCQKKFLDKAYDPMSVHSQYQEVLETDKSSLLLDRPPKDQDNSYKWAIQTSYSVQHKDIKTILSRHWNVLKMDKVLHPLIPEHAKVTFRGAPSLQSKIAPNIINPPVRPSFFHNLNRYYPCKKCVVCCHYINGRSKTSEFSSTVTNRIYQIKGFHTCTSRYVYLITCPCGKQYIGRTTRTFSIRVGEHIAKIKSWDTKRAVPRHYREHHDRNSEGTSFLVIDSYIPPWRGGALTRGVSQLETYWIYELQSYHPWGINVEWDINAFLNKA